MTKMTVERRATMLDQLARDGFVRVADLREELVATGARAKSAAVVWSGNEVRWLSSGVWPPLAASVRFGKF